MQQNSQQPPNTFVSFETGAIPVTAVRQPRLGIGPVGILIRAVVAVFILLGANLVGAAVYGLISTAQSLVEFIEQPSWGALGLRTLTQATVFATALLLVWIWMRFVERRSIRFAGWRFTGSSSVWLLLSTLVAIVLHLSAVSLLPAASGESAVSDESSAGPVVIPLIALVIQAFVLQAIPEELIFRGWFLSALGKKPILAMAVTTLTFTAMHLLSSGGQGSPSEFVLYLAVPFGFSVLAIGMLLWTRSLWAAVGVHGGLHLGNATAAVLLPEVDAALSWVTIGGAYTVVGATLIATALRRGRRIPDSPAEWR